MGATQRALVLGENHLALCRLCQPSLFDEPLIDGGLHVPREGTT